MFIPTVLLSLFVPTMSTGLTVIARWLNDFENYETKDSYDAAMTQKIFVLNFIVSYLPVFLTAFVYVPYGSVIVPYLDIFGLTVPPEKGATAGPTQPVFRIDPSRLRGQVIYFTVTAQLVNQGMENVLPYVKRKVFRKYREYSEEKAKANEQKSKKAVSVLKDAPGEAEFLERVRNEAELSDYDVTNDLREMCVQFGYLSLFSPVWPLVPVSFLINNWIELRSDFVKICIECRRPTPVRADTIGPWLDSLSFLSWLGSITSAALVYMFSNDGLGPDGTPSVITGWALLLSIFFSEHLYLLGRVVAKVVISKIETPASRRERAQRYLVRKSYLDSTHNSSDQENEQVSERNQSQNHNQNQNPNRVSSSIEAGSQPGDSARSKLSSEISGRQQHRRSLSLSEQEEILQQEESKISRTSLEDDARHFSMHSSSPTDLFWARQRGWSECSRVGAGIMEAVLESSAEDKKNQ